MLIFQITRIISSEKWFNYVVTFFVFVLKMPKIWVGRTKLNGGKKEDGLRIRKTSLFRLCNRPFYRYGGHIELIRFQEYYRMPRGHEYI